MRISDWSSDVCSSDLLAECVTEQHRCKAFRTILRPPLEDLGTRGAVRRPYILRRTEGRFGDEHIARHNLEWRTTRIVVTLVIAGHDPDLAVDLDTDLRRAENVPGRMQ